MKSAFRLFALAALLLAPPVMATSPLGNAFKTVRDSVVVINVHEEGSKEERRGVGSGTLISPNGFILTASHVVQTADRIMITYADGTEAEAEVVASEPAADIALIVTDQVPEGIEPARVGNSDYAEPGDQIFVVGAPYGLGHTLTVGHLSARHLPEGRPVGVGLAELFQTDAAINQGNSGGPMINMKGEVIGVVSHMLSRSGGFEGLGFAVTTRTVAERLFERGAFWTGLDGVVIGGRLAKALNIPHPAGYLVTRVAKGSPGEQLGLKPGELKIIYKDKPLKIGGDIVLEVQGEPVYVKGSYARIQEKLAALEPGDKLKVRVLRGGKEEELSTVLKPCRLCDSDPLGQTRPESEPTPDPASQPVPPPPAGTAD
ncbi:MAG: S1C family serine protease [Gammaproteobacteria bacterium]